MTQVPPQEDSLSESPRDFHRMQSKGTNEEVSREFHRVQPNERPLEWRRLLVDAAEQTANDANDQTGEQRGPKIFDIQLGAPSGSEFEHCSVYHPDEETEGDDRDRKCQDLDDGP